ncbi:MAG: hypothetical protein Q7W51_05670 [Coriobacteriia bacterium]|nr:hypothetical protein [Coriobacteriia bacterium]
MKRGWILALVVVAIIASGAVAATYLRGNYAESPVRSLEALAQATRDKDWAAVEAYFDAEAVATRLAESKIAAAPEAELDSGTSTHDDPRGGAETETQLMGRMTATYIENYRQTIQRSVEAGIESGATGVEGVLLAGKASDVEYVSDTEARVTIEVPADEGGALEIIATMVRVDDHWQIIALETVDAPVTPAE